MAERMLLCPVCADGEICDHDEGERRALYSAMGGEERYRDVVEDTTDAAQIGRKAAKKRNAEREAEADLREVMNLPAGRRFVQRLLDRCGIHRRSFNPSLPDPSVTAFFEGQRDVGLGLLGDLARIAPEELRKMEGERVG